ncbi:hypothetical protein J7E89_38970 [Streptomyces sp. ISL-100]|nr:hypothetical protein [Streptomyces sp. ISL-100]
MATQLLFHPALDHRLEGGSAAAYAAGCSHTTTAHMRRHCEQHLRPDGDPSDPHASLGLAPALTGLPPAPAAAGCSLKCDSAADWPVRVRTLS